MTKAKRSVENTAQDTTDLVCAASQQTKSNVIWVRGFLCIQVREATSRVFHGQLKWPLVRFRTGQATGDWPIKPRVEFFESVR